MLSIAETTLQNTQN